MDDTKLKLSGSGQSYVLALDRPEGWSDRSSFSGPTRASKFFDRVAELAGDVAER